MKPFNEQFKINNNELSSNPKEFSNTNKEKEDKSVDKIDKEIINIKDDSTYTSIEKLEKTNELLQSLKQQEIIWQTLSLEEKEVYKQLNPEERDFYLKHPKLRDRLLEGKIKLFELTIGEKNKNQIQTELDEREKISDYNNSNQITVSSVAQELLDHKDFKISKEKKDLKLIKLSVADLGFPNGATFKEIIDKGKELGLDICPPEVGPLLRLDYEKLMGHDQPKNEWIAVAMNTISGSVGSPHVFDVNRYDDGRRFLGCFWADPDYRFGSGVDFLFARK